MKNNDIGIDRYLEERVSVCSSFILQNTVDRSALTIVDLGCGDGRALTRIKSILGSEGINIQKFYAVDIDPSIDISNSVQIINADLNEADLPIQDNSVDIAYALETLEHLTKTSSFVKNTKRILKRDGIFIITTPNLLAWYNRILVPFGSMPIHYEVSESKKYGRLVAKQGEVVYHIRVFSPRALCELLEDNGFKVVKTRGLRFLFGRGSLPDSLFAHFPSLSSCFSVAARKI